MRIFRKLAQMLDLDETNKTAGNVIAVNDTEDGYELVSPTAGSGGAPTDAKYIVQQANAELDAEQALSALSTGLVKVTNGTGVLSTAVGGTDYANASHQHAGEDITSGTVADARIASTIARDSEVTAAISALSSVYQAKDTTLDTYAGIDPAANVQSILSAADYAAIRTLLGLVIGTNVQAFDADLSTWAGLTPSAFFQTLVDDADAATARATLGVIASLFQNGGAQEISLAGLDGTPTELTNHLNDTADAHDASAISVADSGANFTGTDVEAVLAELQDNIDAAGGGGGGGVELGYGQFTAETGLSSHTVICSTGAVVLDGSTPVMIEFNAPKWAGNSSLKFEIYYVKDGGSAVQVGIVAQGLASGGYSDQGNVYFRWPLRGASTPASGSYVFSIRGSSSGGSVYAGSGGTDTLLPGFILVTSLPAS